MTAVLTKPAETSLPLEWYSGRGRHQRSTSGLPGDHRYMDTVREVQQRQRGGMALGIYRGAFRLDRSVGTKKSLSKQWKRAQELEDRGDYSAADKLRRENPQWTMSGTAKQVDYTISGDINKLYDVFGQKQDVQGAFMTVGGSILETGTGKGGYYKTVVPSVPVNPELLQNAMTAQRHFSSVFTESFFQ